MTKTVKKCIVCGRALRAPKAEYCRYCYCICLRMSYERFSPESVKSVWEYIRTYDYVCHYTKIPLDMEDSKNPRYCVFDHWIPGDPKRIVLTTALVNDMKTEQTEAEFWYNIFQLADYKRLGKPIKMKDPVGWDRFYPPEN